MCNDFACDVCSLGILGKEYYILTWLQGGEVCCFAMLVIVSIFGGLFSPLSSFRLLLCLLGHVVDWAEL